MTVLVLDKKLDRFSERKIFILLTSNLAQYQGPVLPPGGDGSPLYEVVRNNILIVFLQVYSGIQRLIIYSELRVNLQISCLAEATLLRSALGTMFVSFSFNDQHPQELFPAMQNCTDNYPGVNIIKLHGSVILVSSEPVCSLNDKKIVVKTDQLIILNVRWLRNFMPLAPVRVHTLPSLLNLRSRWFWPL